MKEQCFDISTWQGGIDYNEIKKRTNYCILRAGFGDFGSGIKDNQFDNHYENLKDSFKIATLIHTDNKTILFSPSTSSYEEFKNFEERGEKFEEYVKES